MQQRNSVNIPGIDISHYDTGIIYSAIAAAGKKAVYIKATEGSTGSTAKDPSFVVHNQNCQALGLATGAYHLIHVYLESTIDAQVANFLEAIKGQALSMPIMLDAEPGIIIGVTPEIVTEQCLEFADKIKAAVGVEVILYTNTDTIATAFTDGIKRLRFVIADTRYTAAPGENGKINSWVGFQYSFRGQIGGQTVDLDEFTMDIIIPAYTYGAPDPAPAPVSAPAVAPIQFDADVLAAQRELNAAGVRDENGNKLIEDGKAGVHTLAALGKNLLVYDPNHVKVCVKLLQKKLGFTGTDIDGRFGNKTLAAVRALQIARGIQVDGKVGAQTWSNLFS
jgi:GH25 family lysozyme M1 (1,4-beta-N-acetylmuramidase)